MPPFLQELSVSLSESVLSLVIALLILIVGWLVALLISALVRGALKRTSVDNRIAGWLAGEKQGQDLNVEQWVSKGVFYFIMVFVLIAFFQRLQLTAVTQPLNAFLAQILAFLPNLLGAGILLLVAWVVATVARLAIRRLFAATNWEDRLAQQAGVEGTQQTSVSETLANVVYWFVFLLFLPAILGALDLQGLLGPAEQMLQEILAILPNVFGAALILVIGWFVARIIRQIVVNLLAAVGIDSLGERIGLQATPEGRSLSQIIGVVVYALVIIPVIIAALNALQIAAISGPATQMLTTLLDAVPAIFGAAVVLVIAYFVGKLVADLVSNVLSHVGFDALLARMGMGSVNIPQTSAAESAGAAPTVQDRQRTPSEIVGYLVLVAIMIFSAIEAANLMGFGTVAVLLAEFLSFIGQVVLALIVFGIGLYFANLAKNVIQGTAGAQSNVMAQIARIAIIIFAAALALRQTGIGEDIVNLAFGLLLGAVAVAAAIAMGLGGREIAARELENLVQSVKSDGKASGGSSSPGSPSSR